MKEMLIRMNQNQNEIACNWVLPRRVLILNNKGGTHYELQRVWSKQIKACN